MRDDARKQIEIFRFYCQKVLPAVFDDSLSYYEAVCKMVEKLNEIIKTANLSSESIKLLFELVEGLQKQLDEFKEHGFDDYYKEQVKQWIDDNLYNIFRYTIRQVFFGLTKEGYVVAYVPDSWSDIDFDTGAVYTDEKYGRLILTWDVDSPMTVEQP